MPTNGRYPAELRERAVRMVLDNERLYGSQWEAICSVAGLSYFLCNRPWWCSSNVGGDPVAVVDGECEAPNNWG